MGKFSGYFFRESIFGSIGNGNNHLAAEAKSVQVKPGISNLSYGCLSDQHLKVSFISEEVAKIGHDPTEIYNQRQTILDLIAPADQEKYKDAISALVEIPGKQIHLSYRLLTKDGSEVLVEDKLSAFKSPDGIQVHGLINTFEFVDQESFFKKLFEAIPTCLVVIDDNRRIKFANSAFRTTFNFFEDLYGAKNICEFLPGFKPEDTTSDQNKINYCAKGTTFEITITDILFKSNQYSLLKIDEKAYQKSASQSLQENNMKFNLAQKVAKIGIWEYNIERHTIKGSSEAGHLIGLDRWDYSLPLEDFICLIGPDQQSELRSKIDRLLTHREDLDGVFELVRPSDGNSIKIQIKAFHSLGHSENVVLGTIQDITTLKETENELKVRNFELNNFVYKVSHDVRAPLVSIEGLINLMKLGQDQNSSAHYLDLVHGSIKKLDLFIRNVLSHSKNLNTELNIARLNFHQIIDRAFAELYYLEGVDKIKLTVKIEGGPFFSDPERVTVIFKNLISNSIQYRYPGRKNPALKIIIKEEGENIVVVFKDNGEGIDQQIQPKIFNMFYRGNEKSKGSGIGLYIVKQTLEKINGSIAVESKVYQGTTVSINLKNYFPQSIQTDL